VPLAFLLARERLSALSSSSLLSAVLSASSSLHGSSLSSPVCPQPGAEPELAAARGAGQRAALGEVEPCSSRATRTCWQQDRGAVLGKIREGAVICLQMWDFKPGSKHRSTGRPAACSLPFKYWCCLF